MAQIVDSYPESNYSFAERLNDNEFVVIGQSFTGDGGTLNSAKFYLQKIGSPSNGLFVAISSHSGVFGTSSIPDEILAVSDEVSVDSIPTEFGLVTFTFTGENKIVLENGVKYTIFVIYDYSGWNISNCVRVGEDDTSLTHDGNYFNFPAGEYNWIPDPNYDTIFYVYKDDEDEEEQIVSPFPTHFRV